MAAKKHEVILVATAAVIMIALAIALAFGTLFNGTPLWNKHFAFTVSTFPDNTTIMQSQNVTIKVDVTYVEGTPEPVSLSVRGEPNGTSYQFSNQIGTPTDKQPFTSNLTINVSTSACSGSYLLEVESTAGAKTTQAKFNLTVVNIQIQVSGRATVDTQLETNGQILDIIPTHIGFRSTATNQTYEAKVNRDINIPLVKTGNYSISLPNQQTYYVIFYCFSYPHFIPVPRIGTEGTENGYFTVHCGAGADTIVADFTG